MDSFSALVEWYKHQKNLSNSEKENIFKEIHYPMISISNLLHKVCPTCTKMADPDLYLSALEYNHMSEMYDGPSNQLVPRKCFTIMNITPSTLILVRDGICQLP